jgi:hypothetical protein
VIRIGAVAVVVGLGVRLVRSRHRRSLHPDGRTFIGELEVWGADPPIGSALVDRGATHPVTVRVSKGIGTRAGRPDVLGLAIRVHGPQETDLLLSTAGTGRFSRHLPVPRRTFDTRFGSILAYRTGHGDKVYLGAGPDADGPPLGRTLDTVVMVARQGRARLVLHTERDGSRRPFGRLRFGPVLPASIDACLAFDPIRNAGPDLHPTGLVHAVRALAYRLSQRWRGVQPVAADASAVARTALRR